jgi:hypothetical protein
MTSRLRTHGTIAAVLILALVAGAGFSVSALESQRDREAQRLRQLAVFEELLTETVQEQVSASVNATIDAARRGDPDGDGVVSDVAAEPLVVKVGAPLAAHGLYVEGYGVMFSIETPQVSVIPQSFERVLADPRTLFRVRGLGENGDLPAPESFGVIELRAEMLDRSIDDLIVLLERNPESGHAGRVQELEGVKATLDLIRAAEGEAEAEPHTDAAAASELAERAAGERRVVATGEQSEATARFEARGRNRWESYYRDAVVQRSDMKDVLDRNARQVAEAMTAAAIDTLAAYGSLIKGLGDDERIAVIVLPAKSWDFARGLGAGSKQDEHVISARYKDIRELDNNKIDYAEFAKRAQIRNRLGLEVIHEDTSEQD